MGLRGPGPGPGPVEMDVDDVEAVAGSAAGTAAGGGAAGAGAEVGVRMGIGKEAVTKALEVGATEPFLIAKGTDQGPNNTTNTSSQGTGKQDKERLAAFAIELEALGYRTERSGTEVFVGVGITGGATARILKGLKTANLTITTDVLRETRIVNLLKGGPPWLYLLLLYTLYPL